MMMWNRWSVCVVIVLLMGLSLSYSKSMWGSRRKKDPEPEVSKPKITKQKMSKQSAPKSNTEGANKRKKSSVPSIDVLDESTVQSIEEVFNAYLKIVEDLLISDDFHTVVNPDSIMSMMSQVPGYADNDQLTSIFASPEFNDPELLKKTVSDGVQMLRIYSEEILDTFRNPMKFSAFLEQLPPEMVELIRGLKSGDTSVLLDFIDALPG